MLNSIIYYVIHKSGTKDYFTEQHGWYDVGSAMRFEKEEFAFGVMKQYASKFKFPCTIEKIYHLK